MVYQSNTRIVHSKKSRSAGLKKDESSRRSAVAISIDDEFYGILI